MPDIKIKIKNLYKIFGPNDKKMINHVEGGMSKTELLDEHAHVLVWIWSVLELVFVER